MEEITTNRDRAESILWQIAGKENWEAIYEVDHWLSLYDLMPKQMKAVFEYKIDGYSNKEISEILVLSERTVRHHLQMAKKRIFNFLL